MALRAKCRTHGMIAGIVRYVGAVKDLQRSSTFPKDGCLSEVTGQYWDCPASDKQTQILTCWMGPTASTGVCRTDGVFKVHSPKN